MAQFDSGSWLDLQGWARASVFICHATGGRCEDWDPWKGANRVLLQRYRDENLYDGPPTVRVYRRTDLTIEPSVDERALLQKAAADGITPKAALDSLAYDKIGGMPAWLHADETPMSLTQQGPMRLVAQMTTNVVGFDITPGGMAYLFIDPYDGSDRAGRLLWQGS